MRTYERYLNLSVVAHGILLVVLISNCGTANAAAQGDIRRIDLMIGALNRVPVSGATVTRVHVHDEGILTARVSGEDSVTLIGLKKGLTSVTIYQGDMYADYVVATWHTLPDRIKRYLNDVPGIEFDVNGDRLLVKGRLLLPADKQRVEKITAVFQDDVINITYDDPQAWKQEMVKRILKEIGNRNVSAHFIGENLVLTGTVHREEDRLRAEAVALAYVGHEGAVSNSIQVIDLPVEISAAFVQLTSLKGHKIGADERNLGVFQAPSLELNLKVNEGDAIGSSLQVGSIGYGLANQTLYALQSKGRAKILREPYVQTISGKPGRVQQGGSLIVRSVGATGAGTVETIDYGLILDIKPVVGPDYGQITLEVSLEVSQPIRTTSGEGVELQKFNTSSHGNVTLGETLVVSGLRQVVRQRLRDNVPIIGNVPLLNLLFAREEQSDEQTDIVVLLTPYLPTIQTSIKRPRPSEDASGQYDSSADPSMTLKQNDRQR